MANPRTYSFMNFVATFVGPNGVFALGQDAGVASEGITFEMTEPKNTRKSGADGSWMHSLHAAKPGRIVIRLLKNSPTNALLNAAYNADTSNPASHGQNLITGTDLGALDVHTGQGCAFAQHPTVVYDVEGQMLEWTFDVGQLDMMLGSGPPS